MDLDRGRIRATRCATEAKLEGAGVSGSTAFERAAAAGVKGMNRDSAVGDGR
jgi:hypothetical protein